MKNEKLWILERPLCPMAASKPSDKRAFFWDTLYTWTNEDLVRRVGTTVHQEWILVRNNMRLGLIGKTIVIVHKRLFFLYKHFLVLERKSRMRVPFRLRLTLINEFIFPSFWVSVSKEVCNNYVRPRARAVIFKWPGHRRGEMGGSLLLHLTQ